MPKAFCIFNEILKMSENFLFFELKISYGTVDHSFYVLNRDYSVNVLDHSFLAVNDR
jgi:hypothetical protein